METVRKFRQVRHGPRACFALFDEDDLNMSVAAEHIDADVMIAANQQEIYCSSGNLQVVDSQLIKQAW